MFNIKKASAMRTLNHFGIPVNYKPEGAMYNEGLNVWLTDFSKSDNKIEFIYLESGESPLPELVLTTAHIAYQVPSLEEALVGKKLLFGPAVCDEHLTIAFIEEEGIALELMEFK